MRFWRNKVGSAVKEVWKRTESGFYGLDWVWETGYYSGVVPIVFCSLEIHLPYSRSLKEKRKVLRKTTDRLRSRFNFSVSEIDHQDVWQRARLGAVSIGPNRKVLESVSTQFIRESERILGRDLVRYDVEIFEWD